MNEAFDATNDPDIASADSYTEAVNDPVGTIGYDDAEEDFDSYDDDDFSDF